MKPSVDQLTSPPSRGPALAKPLAPEDVRVGDYVAPLEWTVQWPSWMWCGDDSWSNDRTAVIRAVWLPPGERQQPQKVLAACLPLVFVKSATGECETLDLRQVRLARLDCRYAKIVWRSLRRAKKSARTT